jgi:general stress protein 26
MNNDVDEDGWSPQGPVTELTDQHSWEFLQRSSLGRLAVSSDNKPAIFPVDFYCDGNSILFRTAEGTKLADLVANDAVAFEADEHTTRESLSVIVEGRAHVVTDESEIRDADRATLPRWIPIAVPVYVRIVPTKIHGRRFSRAIVTARAK